MAKDEHKPQGSIASAVILFSVTAVLAVGSLIGGAGTNASDNPFWKPLLRAHDRISLSIGGDTIGDVYITKDGRMLRKAAPPAAEAVSGAADAVNRFAAESDVSVYLLAVPTSAGIYGESLAGAASSVSEHTVLHDLSAQLSEQVVWIEAESWLAAEKEQYIYYRTDPCWTSYGAYCAYRSAIRRLGFAAVGYDQFSVRHFRDDYRGSLVRQSHYSEIVPDLIDLYTVTDEPEDVTVTVRRSDGREQFDSYYRTGADDLQDDPTKVFFAAAEPLLRIETAHQNSKDLLLLTDRFGAAMIPFLLQHYHIIDSVNLELAGDTDWRSMTHGTYSQILILCGADTVTAPDGLAAMLSTAPAQTEPAP
ncbi:MAG: hypothetical protein IKH27_03170 [Oscillospiraceae bacterium]|nr:hypothetical protein [Oscillospiraceae bacterium]